METFKTTNIDFHAGDVYEHSAWTALYVQDMFEKVPREWYPIEDTMVSALETFYVAKDNQQALSVLAQVNADAKILVPARSQWVTGTPMSIKQPATVAAFLHDIGEIKGNRIFYDKPTHPEDGAVLLAEKNVGSIDMQKLEKELGVEHLPRLLSIVSSAHLQFCLALATQQTPAAYVLQFIAAADAAGFEVNTPLELVRLRISLVILMAISAADMLATQPPTGRGRNKTVENFPEIANRGKTHRGGTVSQNLDIDGKALKFRDDVLSAFDKTADRFFKKW
jgi:hypothetical protein